MKNKKIMVIILVVSIFIYGGGNKILFANSYVIGSEDIIQISVWDNPALSVTVPVRPDGKISFPLLDDIQVSGLTPLQLRDEITKKLSEFVSVPDVTVIILEANSFKVYIIGCVQREGDITLKRETTLLQLIALVGGLSQEADLRNAYLIRKGEKIYLDLYSLIKKGDLGYDILLEAEDTLVVPDNFDSRINVVGEVNQPQTISFKEGLTVLDVILQAGGFTEYANPDGTNIVRKIKKKGSAREEIKVKIKMKMDDIIKKGYIKNDIPLTPGDTIVVPKSFF